MSETQRNCPRCLAALHPAKGPTMVVDMCAECGGAFFDHGELSRLTRKEQPAFTKLEALVKPDSSTPPKVVDRGKLRCPACSAPMDRYEYASCSGVLLDRCTACSGIWIDEGELGRIAEHLERGERVMDDDGDGGERWEAREQGLAQRHRAMSFMPTMLSQIVWPERWL